ncbi:small acid-soluble spore protein Tlp [Ornithinibacillus scapharcae]|uniref:small acid-soluble spore protein Tlp n=1 Tax=Ornithinibacillus scapharcae TaxID=1147159 RepID=UPI000225B35E|nr:small acid-soluble spore protein Tlp [Ornithinibacillus scapharcae]
MTEKFHTPKPDDRSDNVDKLQNMIHDTIENIEAAHETMQFASGEEKQNIIEKNKRREEAIEGFRSEIKDEVREEQ